MSASVVERIPDHTLSDYWFNIKHHVFGALTKAFRDSPYTQEQVAMRLGKSPSQISRLMSGQQNMTLRTMNELARGMGYRLQIEMERLDQIQSISNRPRHDNETPRAAVPAVNQVNQVVSSTPFRATVSISSTQVQLLSRP